MRNQPENFAERAQKRAAALLRIRQSKTLIRYLWESLRTSRPIKRWRELLRIIRGFRTVALILRIITVTVTVLETGAFLLLSTVIFLIVLPVGGAVMLGILLTAALESKMRNREMAGILQARRLYVLYLLPDDPTDIWEETTPLAEQGNVLVISPFWISARGKPGNDRFYFTVRKEAPHVFLVRRYYWFSLKKHVLPFVKDVQWM